MPASMTPTRDRRHLLGLGGTAAVAAAVTVAAPSWSAAAPIGSPFSLGVASGDPTPDGVVLWTRPAPEPLALEGRGGMPSRPVPVQWQVAEDPSFRNIVRAVPMSRRRSGTTRFMPRWPTCVRIASTGTASVSATISARWDAHPRRRHSAQHWPRCASPSPAVRTSMRVGSRPSTTWPRTTSTSSSTSGTTSMRMATSAPSAVPTSQRTRPSRSGLPDPLQPVQARSVAPGRPRLGALGRRHRRPRGRERLGRRHLPAGH